MDSSRIFVKGLPTNITEAEFRKHFSAKGRDITDVKLIPQRRMGYVGYNSADEAKKAVKYFNRTYIRMSRLAVESARPISDLTQTKDTESSRSAPHQGVSSQSNTLSNAGNEINTKKRKRDDGAQSNSRLQEFLEVMGPGREGIIAEHAKGDIGAETISQSHVVLPEDGSDDEYEQLPSRQKKTRTEAQPDNRHHAESSSNKAMAPEAEKPSETAVPEASGAAEQLQETKTAPGATDDDWLRSRTNRLLDLVDPDDLPPAAAGQADSQGTGEVPETAGSKGTQPDTVDEPTAEVAINDTEDTPDDNGEDATVAAIRRTSRLFLRNLSYSTTEDDIRAEFERFGAIQEVHLPCNSAGASKGFALVLFADPPSAVNAFQAMDRSAFQGRILHIIPANAKKQTGLDEFEISKLPLKKQNMIRKKAEAASNTFNWNALYMSQDAVNASVASRLGVTKSELLDPTSADAAVKQAIAETSVIQETKSYFAANGVDLDAFKSQKRGDTAILVKNFPYGTTMEELRKLFEEFGPVLRVLMPPSGTIAIVEFTQANHAKTAFGRLAYRRIKDSVLYLEKAPKDLFKNSSAITAAPKVDGGAGRQVVSVTDLLSSGDRAGDGEEVDTTSLFIRNLNFDTSTSRLAETFESLDGFVSARVKTKMDPKRPGQTLSMGFGFVEFRTKAQAQAALKVMDGYVLDDHTLAVKASHKGLDAAEERRREDKSRKAAGQRTKIVIKNLPFQATKKDVRALFGTYGQLRSIRVPKKMDYTSRGFAFADFVTPREAENALNALRDTHLLGRRLVLDYAEAEAVDAEEEIEKMQRKVGGQVNKVALQQLTGGGRKKVNIGDNEDELEG